jgi:uncharacterized repeat protein (TIGR01451 family)
MTKSANFVSKVNTVFTMPGYSQGMTERFLIAARVLVCVFAVLFGAGMLASGSAHAQTADVDWADAGIGSQGNLPSGTTATGSDGTVATITWSTQTVGGGTFTPPFAPSFVSYFNGTIGDGPSPLFMNFNNSQFDPLDKVTMTITLNRAVTDLNFSLSNVDQNGFTDAVEVFFDDNTSGGFTNAATNTAFWTAGAAVTRTNDATVNGWRGTAASGFTSTDGNVNFDFGGQAVQRIQIVYFSYTGTGDPGNQFVSISDLEFFATAADLSLTKALIGSPPITGGTATWRLTVTNNAASLLTADGVFVEDTFPAGFTFGSASGDGSFNSGTGEWDVGTLAPGDSAVLNITGTVSSAAGTTITNTAEITASSVVDSDSTPNNGVTSEDDFASSSFVVQSGRAPGVPPVLSCPVGVSLFDWDTIPGWTPGTVDNTYDFDNLGEIRFELDNDGVFLNNAAFGGQSPNIEPVFSGGLATTEAALNMLANQANQTDDVEITMTLPRTLTGVQFSIFDVDFLSGQFADRIEVVGSNGGGAEFDAILTNGNVNFVTGGNVAIGDGASASNEAFGNIVVTFTQAVDTIIVRYGNHTTAPVDPGQQAIGIHDITACRPITTLSVSKISSVISDPINGSVGDGNLPKAIPGATVEYLITVSNTGTEATDADTVVVWDDGPADAKMCLMARSGGPVIFGDPGSNTDLIYDYGGSGSIAGDLLVTDDDLEFSDNDGATFDYDPSDDGEGCDTAITDFRVRPGGAMAGGTTFTIRVRYEIE